MKNRDDILSTQSQQAPAIVALMCVVLILPVRGLDEPQGENSDMALLSTYIQ